MRAVIISIIVSMLALTGIFSFPVVDAVPMTFFVNSSDDVAEGDGCEILPDHCSLREAIIAANANPGVDNIRFTGSMTISPGGPLPTITNPVNIDGVLNVVAISGQSAGGLTSGLTFTGGASTVKNLIIIRFGGNGLTFNTPNNVVEGNFIGTNGVGGLGLGNGFHGIQVTGGDNTAIGGTILASRNVISGNAGAGIAVFGSSNVVILGNYIGTDPAGTGAIGNNFGIQITDSPNTTIGGTAGGARNIISGNTGLGILITTDFPAASATSAGRSTAESNSEEFTLATENLSNKSISTETNSLNFDVGQSDSRVNSLDKLEIISISDVNSQIITSQETELPVFSDASLEIGSNITLTTADDEKIETFTENDIVTAAFINAGSNVEGNHIGLDKDGFALGNGMFGIQISDVPDNTIGGTSVAARNFISSNGGTGVTIFGVGASGNVIQGNYIGTNLAGSGSSANGNHGVQIDDAPNNVIGGLVPGDNCTGKCNLISGNAGAGILIGKTHATGNTVQGNFIGTNLAGTGDLGNISNGIQLNGASNIIGGTAPEARNIISGNDAGGIILLSTFGPTPFLATLNTIQGNYIGTDKLGTGAIPNVNAGIQIIDSNTNTIGGTMTGAGNVISGNIGDGIQIVDQLLFNPNLVAFSNEVKGNNIGLQADGITSLGNQRHGILVVQSPANIIGGLTPDEANIISSNGFTSGVGIGLLFAGPASFQNNVQGNFVGTDGIGY